MSLLDELLSSRVRAGVLRCLMGVRPSELHGRELSRRSGFSEATLRQELQKLRRLGLLEARRSGNRVYYSASLTHPVYPELHRLVLKTTGLVDVLQSALKDEEIGLAFVFGSIAAGQETAASDVDLMIIGNLGFRDTVLKLEPVAATLEREINPHVLTDGEYLKRLAAGDHFVVNVLAGPKLFVIGSQNELDLLEGRRLAEA
jgi:DNA-binding transcriptional ArsR family regulator